ncbi:MAG TPA: hypothetical protein PLN18_02265 [Candidatus Colwellbacteria bacterium]|nr:hypothetical protein [Candidatus Colwellbacteria bacterium]HQA96169.1 hypothetical protein [Candidatus Colwellbacteria bacterium]
MELIDAAIGLMLIYVSIEIALSSALEWFPDIRFLTSIDKSVLFRAFRAALAFTIAIIFLAIFISSSLEERSCSYIIGSVLHFAFSFLILKRE